jgi:thiol:disulfide interchange protein
LDLPEQDTPAGMHERIMNRTRSEGSRKSFGWVRQALIPLAAAIMIFLIGRGLPDSLNNNKTAQDNGQPESMLMAVPEESDNRADEDMTVKEEGKMQDQTEPPRAAEVPAPENQAAEGSADSEFVIAEDSGEIRTAGNAGAASDKADKAATENQPLGINQAASMDRAADGTDENTGFSGRMERPSYLKYGIIIALILGLGFAVIRALTKKK